MSPEVYGSDDPSQLTIGDVEKQTPGSPAKPIAQPRTSKSSATRLLNEVLARGKVEGHGIVPLPVEDRTATRYFNVFTMWFSMNTNILAVTFGMLGPAYGLSLRDSSLVILFFTLMISVFPAYLGTLGPKTGMRQMIQARFSFGRYLVSIPVLLNLATLTGFSVIICVVGGQCISAVNHNVSADVGIVIVALCAMVISFCGFKVLHIYEMVAWAPALILIVIATGCGGSQLHLQAPTEPPTAAAVLSFGMIVASYMIPWACLSSDFTTYFNPAAPSWRIFLYAYLGVITPTIPLMVLGAAIGGAIPSNPAWEEGYNSNLVGGVLAAMLQRAGGFGSFVVVVLALTLLGNLAGTMYSITLNFQTLVPWLTHVPRYVFSVVITAVVIPVSIRAAVDFFVNLENFVGLIGYWSAAFVGVVLAEHWVFKKGNCAEYEHVAWNDTGMLPTGVPAIAACVLAFGLIIPCMAQIWFTGPIAKTTGDIGFEVALVLTPLLYVPFRWLERRYLGR
ncbi:NCS1 nucleoside transporter [Coniochaeta sp. 2T2.1]|nr:NCS1 nucleoside transporter [Coniochaeta sp. 2T2.1]